MAPDAQWRLDTLSIAVVPVSEGFEKQSLNFIQLFRLNTVERRQLRWSAPSFKRACEVRPLHSDILYIAIT